MCSGWYNNWVSLQYKFTLYYTHVEISCFNANLTSVIGHGNEVWKQNVCVVIGLGYKNLLQPAAAIRTVVLSLPVMSGDREGWLTASNKNTVQDVTGRKQVTKIIPPLYSIVSGCGKGNSVGGHSSERSLDYCDFRLLNCVYRRIASKLKNHTRNQGACATYPTLCCSDYNYFTALLPSSHSLMQGYDKRLDLQV